MPHKELLRNMHPEIFLTIKNFYEFHDLTPKNIVPEDESHAYGACRFEIAHKKIIFRTAKITPTKIGQFVTLWKRIGDGPIMPFDAADSFDFFIIGVQKDKDIGQFIFSKEILTSQNIISHAGKGGKRALRIYPPWDIPDNQQAQKTQAWQLNYFVDMNVDTCDEKRLKELLEL